ncbi:MAG: fumarate hydratase, partial [Nitrospinota bacterium]
MAIWGGGVRTIRVREVTAALRKMAVECNYNVDPAYVAALGRALETEESPSGKAVLLQLKENAALASRERVPYCQDTGVAVVFCEVGQDVHLEGGSLEEAIHEGIRQGYREG